MHYLPTSAQVPVSVVFPSRAGARTAARRLSQLSREFTVARKLISSVSCRPPFKIIAASLEIAGEELASFPTACFNSTQAEWRQEVQDNMLKLYARLVSILIF